MCRQAKVPCAWGRIFLPYGAGEDAQRLIPSLAAVFAGQRAPFGVNVAARRDFIHATDVAEGLVALLQPDARGIYNIGTGQAASIEDVVHGVAGLLGGNPDTILKLQSARPGDPMVVVADAGKLRELGWRPRLTVSEGVRRTIADMGISRSAAS
jgi:nucleoside-diphosphate-sugar epimerase